MNFCQKFSVLAAVILPVFLANSADVNATSPTELAHQHQHKQQAHHVENQHAQVAEAKQYAHLPTTGHQDDMSGTQRDEHIDHQGKHSDDHREVSALSLTAQQIHLANIRVAQLTPRHMTQKLYAPGEIQANGYTSYFVSPRVESVIVKRHAILGEHVEKGQPLVSLFSEAVAVAQAAYRIAYADWQRAKKVGDDVISQSQLLSAETAHRVAFSRLRAYGLTAQAIKQVIENTGSILGEYRLRAERSGAVLSDDFHQGQRVTAGDEIMVLTDESELWIEARLAATNQVILTKGTQAQVVLASDEGQVSYRAQVIQESHTIDAKTRTRIVRLKVNNTNHQLHPGMFVDVYFSLLSEQPILVVSETALLRSGDGDWHVYTQVQAEQEHSHDEGMHTQEKVTFVAQQVELGQIYRTFSQKSQQWLNWREISGIAKNTKVVMSGAFFIASQSAKSGFDAHNH